TSATRTFSSHGRFGLWRTQPAVRSRSPGRPTPTPVMGRPSASARRRSAAPERSWAALSPVCTSSADSLRCEPSRARTPTLSALPPTSMPARRASASLDGATGLRPARHAPVGLQVLLGRGLPAEVLGQRAAHEQAPFLRVLVRGQALADALHQALGRVG